MDKATKAIRRSGTKLRGLSSRHGSLQVLIGQLGDVRTTCKGFIAAQQTGADDLVRWTNDCDNRAIQDVCAYLSELSLLWTEVQKEFSERLREYRTQFELILEGERHVDQSRELYGAREQREIKCRKDLTKSTAKGAGEELKLMEERVIQAEKSKDLAYLEVVDRIKENEAVKLIRFREGLRKLSSAYVTMGEKCQAVFSAYHAVAGTLPDVLERDIHEVRYTGSREAGALVQRAKEQVLSHRSGSLSELPRSGSSADADSVGEGSAPPLHHKQPQFVQLPGQEKPNLPSKQGSSSKHEEATKSSKGASGGTSGGASETATTKYDPPPSYSSVVEGSDAGAQEGACGFTPSASASSALGRLGSRSREEEDSYDADLPIKVSYPAYLNPSLRHGPRPSDRERPTAPLNGEAGSNSSSATDLREEESIPYRGLARSISDRRVLGDQRNSMHPVLRRQESSGGRPYSSYAEYGDLTRNETQMTSLRLHKNQKKMGFKSLSVAAGNTISGLLGLNNGSNNSRLHAGRSIDCDSYESYDFSEESRSSAKKDEKYAKQSYRDIHGVLPEEIDRCSQRNTSPTRSVSSSGSSRSSSVEDSTTNRASNEKSRALSAKFGIGIPTASDCREELSVPAYMISGSARADEQPTALRAGMISSNTNSSLNKKKSKQSRSRSRSKQTAPISGSPSTSNTTVPDIVDVQTVESLNIDKNNLNCLPTDKITEEKKLVNDDPSLNRDLIDLNVSNEDNTGRNNRNLNPAVVNEHTQEVITATDITTEQRSSGGTGRKDTPRGSMSSSCSSVNSTKSNTSDSGLPASSSTSQPLDGYLSGLAKPKRGRSAKSTNPFLDSGESEEETTNSAGWGS